MIEVLTLVGLAVFIVVIVLLFLEVQKVKDVAIQVDAAVNGKPLGAPTIGEEVTEAGGVLPIVREIKAKVNEIDKRV